MTGWPLAPRGERWRSGSALTGPIPTLIATAISEIARNIVVHAGSGIITLGSLEEPNRYGLVVVARDEGPGIRDVQAALDDEYSGRGGLGLGTVGRPGGRATTSTSSSEVQVRNNKKDYEASTPYRLRAGPRATQPPWLRKLSPGQRQWTVARRCRPGEATCGDLAVVEARGDSTLVAGIDGIGHGTAAERAAQRAAAVVRRDAGQDLVALARRCHQALRGHPRRCAQPRLALRPQCRAAPGWGSGTWKRAVSSLRPRRRTPWYSSRGGRRRAPTRKSRDGAGQAGRHPDPRHGRRSVDVRGLTRYLGLDPSNQRTGPE